MKDEDFQKFSKETWLRFMQYTGRLDQNLFDCLTILERSVQIDKLMAKNNKLRKQIDAVRDNPKKLSQYIKLLKMELINHKKVNRLHALQIGDIQK